MVQISCQSHHLLAASQSLFGITKAPQATGIIGQGTHSCIRPTKVDERAMVLLRVVKGYNLLEVSVGSSVFSEAEQDNSKMPADQPFK
jgi:hypothetical protein